MGMANSTAKENILNKIKQALDHPVPLPFVSDGTDAPLYEPAGEELEIIFAENFTKLQGKFIFCADEKELHLQLHQLIGSREWMKIYCNENQWNALYSNTINLESCDASITGCECLVARTGTIVMSSAQQSGRTVSVYAPIHICIANTNQLVYDIKDALQLVKDKHATIASLITFASGPSRTADIEKTLVTGVHGPKEVYLFLVDTTTVNP
jgi:L-lactate dehydrogenase complex protein LldG